jgi:demethylmenaquinone methyltransferase/2-methoxy-6-polyprenyl-1,4-benzoquinol methylase
MAAVKLGERMLAVGVRNPTLIAQLAVKAGLTGRACVVDDDEGRLATAAAAIEQEGALVEAVRAPYGMWPFDDGSFDVAVIADLLSTLTPDVRVRCVSEVLRILRPGGRVIVLERAPRGGFGALISRHAASDPDYAGAAKALTSEGFAAVRQIAEADGVLYVEGIKKA